MNKGALSVEQSKQKITTFLMFDGRLNSKLEKRGKIITDAK